MKTQFWCEDFTATPIPSRPSYDVILCLSVVYAKRHQPLLFASRACLIHDFFCCRKWMHLNGGDEAVVRLFDKVYAMLRPGGRFVLEPQPWKSYKRNAHASPAAEVNIKKVCVVVSLLAH